MADEPTTTPIDDALRLAGDGGLAVVRAPHKARVRPNRSYVRRRLLLVADTAGVMLALLVSFVIIGSRNHPLRDLAAAICLMPVWLLLFKLYGLYDRDFKRISHSTVDEVPLVFHAMLLGALVLWTGFRIGPLQHLDLIEILTFFVVSIAAVLLGRSAVREMMRSVISPERVLLVGRGQLIDLLVSKMRAHPEYRLEPVGSLEAETDGGVADPTIPQVGTLADLETVCRELRIDRVVAGPSLAEPRLIDLIRRASGFSVPVSLVPNVVDVLGPSVEIDNVQGITVLGINPPALGPSSRLLKRLMDAVLATAGLILLAPVMVAIAIAVKVSSRGPALFTQLRVGRDDREFRLYKFRTMVMDAESRTEELRTQSADPNWLLIDHDPRVTRVGRFLRHSSLDELPQLWNVIKGDMSLVGPRPLTPAEDRQVAAWGRRRLHLTPGITGLWQVLGRTSIPFEEMVKLDYLYVMNWSLWGDVCLLIRTLPSVLARRGVN